MVNGRKCVWYVKTFGILSIKSTKLLLQLLLENCPRLTIEVPPTALRRLTLSFEVLPKPLTLSFYSRRAMVITQAKDQGKMSLGQKLVWVETRTDGRSEGGDCITYRANAVSKNSFALFFQTIRAVHAHYTILSLMKIYPCLSSRSGYTDGVTRVDRCYTHPFTSSSIHRRPSSILQSAMIGIANGRLYLLLGEI